MMEKMYQQGASERFIAELYGRVVRRAGAAISGGCPVELTAAFVRLCLAQSCGKCVPCREGLARILERLEKIAAGEGSAVDLSVIREEAQSISDTADCAIGFETAKSVLESLEAFRADYESHIEKGACSVHFNAVPCRAMCPAHVNVPAYIACIGAGRAADAVRIIRQDNPFPGVCGLICEHPCERACRRAVVDDAVNIRALKRYAVETAGDVPPPPCAPKTGKRVGIVGGGPAGLTAAYYLALGGFDVTVFEKREKLGGMLRYGIPAYRLPDEELDREIQVILSLGVHVELGVSIGRDLSFQELRGKFDAVYLSIGAHGAKRLGIEGEDAKGVVSAVELLGAVEKFDFQDKRVVVIGGGNVAMDATRTARRLGAAEVTCVYRRRIVDMTALPEEVASAQAEGCEILQLMAPLRINCEEGRVRGLVVKPQLAGPLKGGRPTPVDASAPEQTLSCDFVIVAIGQDIESASFAAEGFDVKRGAFIATEAGEALVKGEVCKGVFTGGDCQSGPATVIRAIDAGKIAARNIAASLAPGSETHLGQEEIEVPAPTGERLNWGRVNLRERPANERKNDFVLSECGMTDEEAKYECARCLRCDRCGYGAFHQ